MFETSLVTEFNCSIKFKLVQKKVFGKIVVKIKHKFTKLCKKMLNNIDIELPLSEQSDREKTVEEVTACLMSIQRMNCAFGPSAMEIDANITETFSSLSGFENIEEEEKLQEIEKNHEKEEGANI